MKIIKALLWIIYTAVFTGLYFAFIGGIVDFGNIPNLILMMLMTGGFATLHFISLAIINSVALGKSVTAFKLITKLKEGGALHIVGGIALGVVLSPASIALAIFTHIQITLFLITGKGDPKPTFSRSYTSPQSKSSPTPAPKPQAPKPAPKPVSRPATEINTKFNATDLEYAIKNKLGNGSSSCKYPCRYCKTGYMQNLYVGVYNDRNSFEVTITGKIILPIDKVAFSEAVHEIGNVDIVNDHIREDAQSLVDRACNNLKNDAIYAANELERSLGPTPKDVNVKCDLKLGTTA